MHVATPGNLVIAARLDRAMVCVQREKRRQFHLTE